MESREYRHPGCECRSTSVSGDLRGPSSSARTRLGVGVPSRDSRNPGRCHGVETGTCPHRGTCRSRGTCTAAGSTSVRRSERTDIWEPGSRLVARPRPYGVGTYSGRRKGICRRGSNTSTRSTAWCVWQVLQARGVFSAALRPLPLVGPRFRPGLQVRLSHHRPEPSGQRRRWQRQGRNPGADPPSAALVVVSVVVSDVHPRAQRPPALARTTELEVKHH